MEIDDDDQETVAIFATIIGVYGFIMGTILICEVSPVWFLMVFYSFIVMKLVDRHDQIIKNMRS